MKKTRQNFCPGQNTIVAVDSARGCGEGEMVLFCQGSSAYAGLAGGMKDATVDAVIIGIVDSVDVFGNRIFSAKT